MKSNDLPFVKKRVIVLHEANWRCALCGGEADEVDHIWPRDLGGTDDLSNLQAACRRCNAKKGSSFYLDDLTPARIDMFTPQIKQSLRERAADVARWLALRAELVSGADPAEAYFRLIKSEHPLYGPVPAEFVREVLASLWQSLLHETPGQAALDAIADLDHLALVDATDLPQVSATLAELDGPLEIFEAFFGDVAACDDGVEA